MRSPTSLWKRRRYRDGGFRVMWRCLSHFLSNLFHSTKLDPMNRTDKLCLCFRRPPSTVLDPTERTAGRSVKQECRPTLIWPRIRVHLTKNIGIAADPTYIEGSHRRTHQKLRDALPVPLHPDPVHCRCKLRRGFSRLRHISPYLRQWPDCLATIQTFWYP